MLQCGDRLDRERDAWVSDTERYFNLDNFQSRIKIKLNFEF